MALLHVSMTGRNEKQLAHKSFDGKGGGIVGKQETRWNLSAAVSENFIQAIVVREQAERSMLRESDFT